MPDAIEPFVLAIDDADLLDLRERLARTRWPQKEPVGDWSQGAPLRRVQALCEYWRTAYDWRRCEALLNGLGQFKTVVDGLDIHFLHIRSPEPNALPIIMTHGWPGSVIEFHKVIGPLTDPVAHGGSASDAFDLVLPSLPGFGFSGAPNQTGWGIGRIAETWSVLMSRLGYTRWGAQGGDWGAAITKAIARRKPEGCVGIHLNMPLVTLPADELGEPSAQEAAILSDIETFSRRESGYGVLQSTRPQTLGYALADSPAGQAAWIYEKYHAWTDNPGDPEAIFTMDEMLDNISLYWFSNTGASSARLYLESWTEAFISEEIDLPVAVSVFPRDPIRATRRWGERWFRDLRRWTDMPEGGHFAAFEKPALFVEEVRAGFRTMR